MQPKDPKPTRDMDEKIKIDLTPDVALDALLKVDPESAEAEDYKSASGEREASA